MQVAVVGDTVEISVGEELIRSRILEVRPDDAIRGEEGEDHAGTSGVRWMSSRVT